MIERRGIVLSPADLHGRWLELLREAGLNVLGLHGGVEELLAYVESERGQAFLSRVREMGIAVEYELHAMSHLLPRKEFETHPEWFRMDGAGQRTLDANLCASNCEALEVVASNAARLAEALMPTTNRYSLWADDAAPWCACDRCRGLSPSDQNLIVMNAIVAKLRETAPGAMLAYLAYLDTLDPPRQVRPADGIFLEFAPIRRRYDAPLEDEQVPEHVEHVTKLDQLIELFGVENAQVLEYWLDASLFCKWKKPATRLPFSREVVRADVGFYARKGFRSITSFGVYLDAEYFAKFGTQTVTDYGAALSVI